MSLNGVEPPAFSPIPTVRSQLIPRQVLDWISELCERRARILDCACGKGDFINLVKNKEYEVIGVDASISKIKLANQLSDAIVMDATNLGFKDEAFDVVTSIETIEHLTRPYDMLKEFARVLKENGILIISTPNPLGLRELYVNWRHQKYADKYHRLSFTRILLEKALTLTGFDVKKFKYLNFWIPGIKIPLRCQKVSDNLFGIWCSNMMLFAIKKKPFCRT